MTKPSVKYKKLLDEVRLGPLTNLDKEEALLEVLDGMYKEIQTLKNKKPQYVPPTRYA